MTRYTLRDDTAGGREQAAVLCDAGEDGRGARRGSSLSRPRRQEDLYSAQEFADLNASRPSAWLTPSWDRTRPGSSRLR